MSHPIPTFASGFLMFLYFLVFYRTGQVTRVPVPLVSSNCSWWLNFQLQLVSSHKHQDSSGTQNMFIPWWSLVILGERTSFGMPSDCQITGSYVVPAVAWLPLREWGTNATEISIYLDISSYIQISPVSHHPILRAEEFQAIGNSYTNCTGQVGAAAQAGGGPVYAVASLRRRDIQ